MSNDTVETTLAHREKQYGHYEDTARISQCIKIAMQSGPSYADMSVAQRESLDMIASKIARICNGNPNHVDSWHDIAGYATLVENTFSEGG
jgi:hypothetical protein